jgi:hypothetical protein
MMPFFTPERKITELHSSSVDITTKTKEFLRGEGIVFSQLRK